MPLKTYIDLIDLEIFKEESDKANNKLFASKLDITQNKNNGLITIKLIAKDDTLLDTKTLDLDTEHIIKDVTLNYQTKELIFTMMDNTTISCSISELVDDLKLDITNLSNSISTLENKIKNANIELLSNAELDEIFPNLEGE